jgi:hypothetical protein
MWLFGFFMINLFFSDENKGDGWFKSWHWEQLGNIALDEVSDAGCICYLHEKNEKILSLM